MKLWRYGVLIAVLFGAFCIIGRSQVFVDASVVLDADICAVIGTAPEQGRCVVSASVTHRLISGDAALTLKDGRTIDIDQNHILMMSYSEHKWF